MAGNKTAYTPDALRVRLRCTKKHVVRGLFVIYRVIPADPPFTLSCELLNDRYTLAFSDHQGDLALLGADDDPWPRFYAGKPSPHRPKITVGSYECYFVRHPNVKKAFQVRDWLNDTPDKELAKLPHEQRPVAQRISVSHDGRQRLIMELNEDPASYWPAGGVIHGGWTLYRDMPHAECEPVQKAVKKLQADLGAVRYPIGIQEAPYVPRPGKTSSFDAATHSAVLAFQTDHNAKKILKVRNKEACHDSTDTAASSWMYLNAEPLAENETAGLERLREDGVVDAATSDAISHWVRDGYRKAGMILVDVAPKEDKPTWYLWLRWPTAMRVKAWRELIKQMGCPYGLRAGHSFRDALHDVTTDGRGVAGMSLHKTGMAIDLGVKGTDSDRLPEESEKIADRTQQDYTGPVQRWPVIFERKVDEHLDANSRMHRIRWRIYGHSTVRAFSDDANELRKSQVALLKSLKNALPDLTNYWVERLGVSLLDVADNKVRDLATFIDTQWQKLIAHLNDHPAVFFERFYRKQVRQWHYDPNDGEGGKAGDLISPSHSFRLHRPNVAPLDDVVEANPKYHSFVSFTALAWPLDLLRIGRSQEDGRTKRPPMADQRRGTVWSIAQSSASSSTEISATSSDCLQRLPTPTTETRKSSSTRRATSRFLPRSRSTSSTSRS